MFHDFSFADVLATSTRVAWTLDDILPAGATLDFERDLLPEPLARIDAAPRLLPAERRTLNHIRGHEYLSIFGLVEEFILPFVLDHVRPHLSDDDDRVRALLNFAGEEAKHIQLFKRFHQRFVAGFGTPCQVIGPPAAIAAAVLAHEPLSVALLILHIEWMSQRHYVDSIRDDGRLDPLFKSLLRHHWIEEAQHAKLDTLMVEALADGRAPAAVERAVDGYLELGQFLDDGLRTQAGLNLEALQAATGRLLPADDHAALLDQQHQALRWTYIGSGMTHPKFVATLGAISPTGATRVAAVAPTFC